MLCVALREARLGLPKEYAFHEVLGLEEELLAMVPQPVQAVMMLYPLSADKPDATGNSAELSRQQSVWFTKQTVPNGSGLSFRHFTFPVVVCLLACCLPLIIISHGA